MEIKGEGLPTGDVKKLLSKSYDKTQSSYGDYQLDKGLSGQCVQVYWNAKMGKAVVVHRGTAGVQDMVTDVRYTFGDKSGHSLGSVLGETAVKGNNQELITLNKPVGLGDIGKNVSTNQTDLKTERDPVSFLRGAQKGNRATIIKSKTYNPLTEHSTDTLDRLNEDEIIGLGLNNNISNIYSMPKISRDAEFVYIPQVKKQIFGTGLIEGSSVKYGRDTGIVKSVHLSGRGNFSGKGLPPPPSRRIAVS